MKFFTWKNGSIFYQKICLKGTEWPEAAGRDIHLGEPWKDGSELGRKGRTDSKETLAIWIGRGEVLRLQDWKTAISPRRYFKNMHIKKALVSEDNSSASMKKYPNIPAEIQN